MALFEVSCSQPRWEVAGLDFLIDFATSVSCFELVESLPTWAAQLAVPRGIPLIVRLIYPDLARGRAVNDAGTQRRRVLLTMWRRGGFRPIRVLQLVLPEGRIPVESRVPMRTRVVGAARRASLLVENAWFLGTVIARERRGRG